MSELRLRPVTLTYRVCVAKVVLLGTDTCRLDVHTFFDGQTSYSFSFTRILAALDAGDKEPVSRAS